MRSLRPAYSGVAIFHFIIITMLGLTGCQNFGTLNQFDESGGGFDTALTSDDLLIKINDIYPAFGYPTGGDEITISGRGFEGSLNVTFGIQRINVTVIDSETLVIITPEWDIEESVDVTVSNYLGDAVAENGFTYSYTMTTTETNTSATTGTNTGLDNSGKVTGYIDFSLMQVACPTCFTGLQEISVYAEAEFHAPITSSWFDWMPANGDCSTSADLVAPTNSYQDVGDWVYLETGTSSHSLNQTINGSSSSYLFNSYSESDFLRSTSYDLSIPDGDTWGSAQINDVLTTPQGFDSIIPAQVLSTTLASAFAPIISASGQTVSWSPSGGSGDFFIRIDSYDASGYYQSSILCRGDDNGSMYLPNTVFAGMQTGNLLAIYYIRSNLSEATNSVDGGTIEADASFIVLGTATLKP